MFRRRARLAPPASFLHGRVVYLRRRAALRDCVSRQEAIRGSTQPLDIAALPPHFLTNRTLDLPMGGRHLYRPVRSRERNAQVSLMHQTYGDALSVSVWLGLPKTPARWPSSVPIKTFDSEHGVDWQNSMKFLANRAYWNRRWVIQEFLLAKDVQIYCGNSCTTFWNFRSELCDMIDMDSLESDSSKWRRDAKSSQFAALPLLMNRQADKHPELSRPPHELLIDHREAKCTDPRDRVFSLLSLTTPNEQRLLRRLLPDYSLSEDQVIIFALAHLLHFTRLMDFDLLNGPESKHIFQALGLSGQQRSRLVGQAT